MSIREHRNPFLRLRREESRANRQKARKECKQVRKGERAKLVQDLVHQMSEVLAKPYTYKEGDL